MSTEIMLCADAHNASSRSIGSSAANTACGRFTAACIQPSNSVSRGAPHNTIAASGMCEWTFLRSSAQRSIGHALSSRGETSSLLPRIVRRLPGCTRMSGRPDHPCAAAHASQSARAAADTSRRGAHSGGGAVGQG